MLGLSGLWARLKGRFQDRAVQDARLDGRGQSAPHEARRPQSGFLDPDTFAQVIQGVADADQGEERRLHVFSLADFRNAVGSKWGRLGALLEVAGDAIIRRHIDLSKDVVTRLDAEIACLAMPVANRQETRTRVASIATDLSTYLFGDAVINGRRPQVVAANMAFKDAIAEDGSLDHDAIRKAVATAGAALEAGAAQVSPHRATLAAMLPSDQAAALTGASRTGAAYSISGGDKPYRIDPDSVPQWVTEEPAKRRASDQPLPAFTVEGQQQWDGIGEKPAWAVEGAALRGADAPMTTWTMAGGNLNGADAARQSLSVEGNALTGADAARQTMVVEGKALNGADAARQTLTLGAKDGKGADWLEEQMERQAQAGLTSGSHLNADSSLTLVWTPTWVATRRAVGAFHAKVIRVDRDGAPPLEGVRAYTDAAPIESLTMDRFIATQAAYELKDLFYGRHKVGLTVPFHWMSLAPRWRDCIRIPFETCPPQALRKLLKIEIFGLSPAIPPHVINRLFEPLEKLDCPVMARLPLSAPGMVKALKGVRAIGIDLAELHDDEKVGDLELLQRMERFRDVAHKSGMACYVWGIRRRPLIAQVIKAGFSLVNGPGVMCDLAHPRPATANTAAE
ncbi:MAG: hypothetical protein HY055_14620 [Magnetospirillum sp.]|nr:hypothetical protein [Magnetospirillum sp.]MBI3708013.1 hypothetical protein [Pseudomonadota bacterium]